MTKSKILLEAPHTSGVPIPKIYCVHWAHMVAIALAICAAISALALSDHRPDAGEKPIRAFYISPYGSDFNPGTKEAPFLTFKKADSVVQAGETVYVLP